MKKSSKALKALLLLMAILMAVSFTACKKRTGATKAAKPENIQEAVEQPTDNDEEGWFSIEVLSQYSASSFTIPEGAVVTDKPEKDFLYLKGGSNLLQETALRAYSSIKSVNDKVAFPVYTISDDGVATVTSFKAVTEYDGKELAPQGSEEEVTFAYKSGHKYYECKIGNYTDSEGNKLVYVDFTNKTEEYKGIFNKP